MANWQSLHINGTDFSNVVLAYMGTAVSVVPVTESEDFRGNKTFVYSGTFTKTVVFKKNDMQYSRDKEGVQMTAPAYLMQEFNTGTAVKRGDKIVVGTGTGSVWRVHNAVNYPTESPIYTYSELYVWT